MVVIPDTDIYLLKSPLTLSNKHQITFQNEEAQFNYFNSLPKIQMDDTSYQRKDGYIRYFDNIENIREYNYCMYRNSNYSNKWFYAFITNMTYENDGLTYVFIKTDVFQTWQFQINWRASYIEREMINVNEDVPGANLIPETFETGEYKVGGTAEIDDLEPWYIVAYAEDTYGFKVNGIYSGIQYYVFSDTSALRGFLVQIKQASKDEFILSIFTVPKLAFYPVEQSANPIESDRTATPRPVTLTSTPSSLDGYTPKNQKLRQFPFMYVGFNPNGGSSKIYRYEDFTNGTPQFKMISEVNPNPQVAVIPQNYRGAQGDSMQDIGLISGYPTIGWSNDVFNVWLAQNSNIIQLQEEKRDIDYIRNSLSNAWGFGQSASTPSLNLNDLNGSATSKINSGLDILGTLANSFGGSQWNQGGMNNNYDYAIKMQNAQIEKQQMLPDTANFGSNNATLLGYNLFDKNVFTRYTIKNQFARKIDMFFDMFGYLTNELKLPNLTNRPNWNYVKTLGANILGNIPQLDLQEIKNIFDGGVTLWHNPSTFLDYLQNNR